MKETPTLHLGDTVEEIATKRQGKIDNMSMNHEADGTTTVNYWRVTFRDGKQPLYGMFKDASDVRLVNCPRVESEPRFVPERPIMG